VGVEPSSPVRSGRAAILRVGASSATLGRPSCASSGSNGASSALKRS
jgi:hypothetical protein